MDPNKRRYPQRKGRRPPERYVDPARPSEGEEADESILGMKAQMHMDAITRNRNKVIALMSSRGSRRLIKRCSERIEVEISELKSLGTDVESKLNKGAVRKFFSVLIELKAGTEQLLDEIDQHLEDREGEQKSVSVVDSLDAQTDLPNQPSVRQGTNQPDPTAQTSSPPIIHMAPRSDISYHHASRQDAVSEPLSLALERLTLYSELPAAPIVVFDGEPINYTRFIQDFRARVDDKPLSEAMKFAQLAMATSGRAKEVVELYRGYSSGYYEALVTLKERFGQPSQIVNAHFGRLRETRRVGGNESEQLLKFSDQLKADRNAFSELGYLAEADCQSNLKIIFDKLPARVQARWAETCVDAERNGQRPTFSKLVEFVDFQARKANHPIFSVNTDNHPKGRSEVAFTTEVRDYNTSTSSAHQYPHAASQTAAKVNESICPWCTRDHPLTQCPIFALRPIEERRQFIVDRRLCFCCFGPHPVKLCARRTSCKIRNCIGFHHPMIHRDRLPRSNGGMSQQNKASTEDINIATQETCSVNLKIKTPKVLLRVVPVSVSADGVNHISTYALLDTGSTCTIVSRRLAEAAGLTIGPPESITINTVLGTGPTPMGYSRCTLASTIGNGFEAEVTAVYVADELGISNLQIQHSGNSDLEHLAGLMTSRPVVDIDQISVLIGEDVPSAHRVYETRYGTSPETQPYGVLTPFGWCIAGPTGAKSPFTDSVNQLNTDELGEKVDQWWNEERHGFRSDDGNTLSREDKQALQMLSSTVTLDDGHYSVGMLWRDATPRLHNNLSQATKRLHQLRTKFQRDPLYASAYTEAMDSSITEGYMRRISREEELTTSDITWYLPHHGVSNPNKPGKVRPVKDAASTYLGTSLNKSLLSGPDLANSIIGVIMRFRLDRIALIGDIKEMFMQVKVPPRDQDALRVLWWGDGMDQPPVTYKMTRHVFGAKDSPCICNYALRKCASDNAHEFSSQAVRTVNENFYVDDLVCSVPDPAIALTLATELVQLLKKGGFQLTKFISNSEHVLDELPDTQRAISTVDLTSDGSRQRTLGVTWEMGPDTLRIRIRKDSFPETVSRRSCVSVICAIYDPLGICCPGTLPAKRIIQAACEQKLAWDEPLPEDLLRSWQNWISDLHLMERMQTPRCLLPDGITWKDVTNAQLHHFSDASEIGYGTVSYLRLESKDGVTVRFLLAKSRCAPKEFVSIPRLELQAAMVASRVDRLLRRELKLHIQLDSVQFWTDSAIVLGYLKNQTKRYKTFVANRIEEIRDSSDPDQWRHCPTDINPADIASRGSRLKLLVQCKVWMNGPAFLLKREIDWPHRDTNFAIANEDPEVKVYEAIYTTADAQTPNLRAFMEHYSEFGSLVRGAAWLKRFCEFTRDKGNNHKNEPLNVHDLNEATTSLVRYVQRETYPDTASKQHLIALNPFEDDQGILRVGGRLSASGLPYKAKHPVILPKVCHLSTLLIRHYHYACAHSGQEHTLAELRKKYWIVNAKSGIRAALERCIICRKIKGQLLTQIMADLPKDRTESHQPAFTICGIDAFGPLNVKRGRGTAKRYGIILTCFSTRAIHLELAEDMTADAAMNAIRRFMARRGTPDKIYADNGGNFVGVSRELRKSIREWNELVPALAQRGIEFSFITPYASHMAGVWERLIKTVKQSLQAVLGNGVVREDMLQTVLVEVESIVNTRPLVPSSDDVDDLEALTPAHFLLGKNCIALPPGCFNTDDKYRRRWKATQSYVNAIWTRWLRSYLPTLQRRSKWRRQTRESSVGDLVLISDENTPRGSWPLGRIVAVYPSADGKVRSVDIKTRTGISRRPIHKLCLLEAAE